MTASSLLKPKYKEVSIETSEGLSTVRFYPVRLHQLWKMREIAKKLFTTFGYLMGTNQSASPYRTAKEPDGTFLTFNDPANPEVLDALEKKRTKAIEEITEALLDPKNVTIFMELIIDSTREVMWEKSAQELAEEIDTGTFIQFVMGLIEANLAVFGPLGRKLSDRFKQGLEEATGVSAQDAVQNDGKENENK